MRRLILLCVLVVAIFAGGYALLAKQKPKQEMVSVLVATADMPSGRFIPLDSVELQQVTSSEQLELAKARGTLVPASSRKDLQNYVPRSSIRKGDVITEKNLIRPSDPDFLPSVLNQGQRAVTIRLNDVASGVGLYRPGNYVDVILTYTDNSLRTSQNQKRVAVTLFRGLRILALGGDLGLSKVPGDGKTEKDKKISSVVTLEASPRQAEEIILASKLGDLSLSLRATEGKDAVSEPTSTFARDLMQKDSQSATVGHGKETELQAPVKIRGLYGDQQRMITFE